MFPWTKVEVYYEFNKLKIRKTEKIQMGRVILFTEGFSTVQNSS